jgi:hypothetical protein
VGEDGSSSAALGREPSLEDLLICRVDLLPVAASSTIGNSSDKSVDNKKDLFPALQWRVSEIEGMWCECFLRAAPTAVAIDIAKALSQLKP